VLCVVPFSEFALSVPATLMVSPRLPSPAIISAALLITPTQADSVSAGVPYKSNSDCG
jgi:hypothetical protein